jgi:hypothetical protein
MQETSTIFSLPFASVSYLIGLIFGSEDGGPLKRRAVFELFGVAIQNTFLFSAKVILVF